MENDAFIQSEYIYFPLIPAIARRDISERNRFTKEVLPVKINSKLFYTTTSVWFFLFFSSH